jgi:hypothetical protein
MHQHAHTHTDFNRRQFLHRAFSGAAVGIAAQAGIELAFPPKLRAQTTLTPDAALHELFTGNQRFAANQLTSVEHDLTLLKEHTVDKQEPFAAVLAFADSRVPVELVFDQTIGQIFVTRVVGNMVTSEIIASCCPWDQNPASAWPFVVRRGKGGDEGRRRPWTDKHLVPTPSARGGTIRRQYR